MKETVSIFQELFVFGAITFERYQLIRTGKVF